MTTGQDDHAAESERNGIEQLAEAHRQLMEAKTVQDILVILDFAEAARVFAKQARWGTASINKATEVKLLAEIRLADAIDAGQAAGEIAKEDDGRPGVRSANTYGDLGTSARKVHEARSIRDTFTNEDVARIIMEATKADRDVARYRLLRDARYARAARQRDRASLEDLERLRALPPTMDIRLGNFTEVLADVRDVDAVITDPPYPHEFLGLYLQLAEWADKVLAPDGVLVVMTGHMYLPEVYELLGTGGRKYRWTCAYLTPGAHNTVHARRVMQGWKPLLIYGGGPRFHDVFRSPGDDKGHHYWGQNLDAFTQVVETFTRPGQLVADPFLGGGTTAAACLHTDRAFVGADVDPEAVESTRERLLWEQEP